MYTPSHFKQEDPAELRALIREFPLACIVANLDGKLVANHIPLLLHGEPAPGGRLLGHIAKANPLCKFADGMTEVLAVFQGPTSYITPNWYPTKEQTHQTVPTYNYAVVHVRGRLTSSLDEGDKRQAVEMLTDFLEASRAEPWSTAEAPEIFVQLQLKGIVAIRVDIAEVQAKWKVSQNRPLQDRLGVAEGLLTDSLDSQASLMSRMVKNASEK